ncbi:helix-hairpin-helix domain-containing protein [Salipaludibacillus daqingensis]|uniref:helix-hairpin-helix domain-containing protein n=1 Tax=Salipaludibacillus daqingensis TaxID=3041001 RepID=UPI00314570A9
MLHALATFQRIPSIGAKMATNMVDKLGIYSLEELKNKNGAELLNALERELGFWIDPCAEDQIRCIVHYAINPESDKYWYDFTEERKLYRTKYGYPASRPKKAWYDN